MTQIMNGKKQTSENNGKHVRAETIIKAKIFFRTPAAADRELGYITLRPQ